MTDYAFKTGTATVLEGQIVPDPATLLPSSGVYLTVQTGVPSTFSTPLVYDDTVSTGGLYAWNGTAYVQVSNVVT